MTTHSLKEHKHHHCYYNRQYASNQRKRADGAVHSNHQRSENKKNERLRTNDDVPLDGDWMIRVLRKKGRRRYFGC